MDAVPAAKCHLRLWNHDYLSNYLLHIIVYDLKAVEPAGSFKREPKTFGKVGNVGLPGCWGSRHFQVFLFPAQSAQIPGDKCLSLFLVTCNQPFQAGLLILGWQSGEHSDNASSHVNSSNSGSWNEKPRRLRLEGEMNYLHCLEVPAQLNW